jgi:hypothetical protein
MQDVMRADCASVDFATFLPGRIVLQRGGIDDYRELAHFHYSPTSPATWAGVWRAVYSDLRFAIFDLRLPMRPGPPESSFNRTLQIANCKSSSRVIAVAVLSYPTPSHRVRERVLGLTGPRYGQKLRFINANLRTISRVIVHPQFRALGLASALVRRICQDCPVRYVEAIATMGRVHPFFQRGGMRRVGEAYFIFDREERRGNPNDETRMTKPE